MVERSLREIGKELQAECGKGFWIGNEIHFAPVHLNGRFFHFKPHQNMFLHFLRKFDGSVEKAANGVGWSLEQVQQFFSTRKWREYKEMLIAKAATRNGDMVDFWWDFMIDGAKGFQERFEGECSLCHQEYKLPPAQAEQYRTDNMELKFECLICRTAVDLLYQQKDFKPSREQVQCAVEIGHRVEPKREKIQHTFSDETFVFSTGEENDSQSAA